MTHHPSHGAGHNKAKWGQPTAAAPSGATGAHAVRTTAGEWAMAHGEGASGPLIKDAMRLGRIHLLGAMRVECPDGTDCTPSGMFRKALLAAIVLGQRGSRARSVLHSMLWPGKPSSNLRTALSVLRRELKPLNQTLDADLFEVTGQSVTIDLSRVWVDVLDAPGAALGHGHAEPELLEGLDLPGAQTEEFEDWLRQERSNWADRLDGLKRPVRPAAPAGPASRRLSHMLGAISQTAANPLVPGFGLFPINAVNLSPMHARLADSVLDSLGSSLRELCQAEIYDFRPAASRGFVSPNGPGPDYMLALSVIHRSNHIGLSLRVLDAARETLVWEHTLSADVAAVTGLDSLVVAAFVDQCCDRLAALTDTASFGDTTRPGTPYHAINLMFQLDETSVTRADTLITQATAQDQSIVFKSLASYLDTIRVGESLTDGEPEDDQIERVLHVAKNFAREPDNALALTTAGYALDFLTADAAQAEELLVRAIEVNPAMAFCWDHLAMFHWRRGNYDKAFACAKRALHLSAHSPLRYVYETTLCMISTVRGEYETAAHYGKRALAKSPHFAGALQYTAASLAYLGRSSEAALCISRMREWEPDLSLEVFADRVLVRSDEAACKQLMLGLERTGLI